MDNKKIEDKVPFNYIHICSREFVDVLFHTVLILYSFFIFL